jgi:hypothetical protein
MSIKTWATGERVTAAKLNTIRDELDKPLCKLVQQVAQSIANSTDTALTFGTGSEDFDTHGFHSETTNNTRITPSVAGYYLCYGTFFMSPGAYTSVIATIAKNGTVVPPRSRFRPEVTAPNLGTSVPVSVILAMNGSTDYVELFGQQSSGGAVNTNVGGSFASVFGVEFIRSL